ncbi:uncharacterized protein [Solanum tuberosum]|uniref:DUF620 family protein n=1 Tax=Solanum tuberosum TaxID=4113 RepID=M1A2I1_SOLTU|nr:PREDICTED: uncharacterized protein LOC102585210 [Solanum tuberosum]KAH0684076.1 hypothetical protein KY289_021828 [Solanum tuberosum]KAH0695389.1 hypothetical protein KY285_022486 [Solanum tuberosum]
MRKLCPNLDKEDGLDTVLEVPLPEEMFSKTGGCSAAIRWKNMLNLMRADKLPDRSKAVASGNNDQFMFLLKIVGSALIPFQVQLDHAISLPVRDGCIKASSAKYIVQQYLAASGGQAALNSINSMYAVGQLQMAMSDIQQSGNQMNSKRTCEDGGFVLWQKNPDLWFLEFVVSDCKVSAGSNGTVAWSHSSTNSNASKGPPRPLRRFFQGLDPRSTANLFLNAVCIGEKKIKDEGCFILKLETSKDMLKAQSTANTEVVHHTIWGYFSQRLGVLIQFEDTKLVRLKSAKDNNDSIFWETSMESTLKDYRYIEGINIAHSGRTAATIYRYGKNIDYRAKVEETWKIEEIDFNISGLSMDCFLPPADVNKENEQEWDSRASLAENRTVC